MHDVKIIADLKDNEQYRVAVLEDGKLAEIFIEYSFDDDLLCPHSFNSRHTRQGDIFKARIDKIVPAISAAFVILS